LATPVIAAWDGPLRVILSWAFATVRASPLDGIDIVEFPEESDVLPNVSLTCGGHD
jgi:hypothetical protein